MKNTLVLAFLLLLPVSCSPLTDGCWTNPGAGRAQLAVDSADCLAAATAAARLTTVFGQAAPVSARNTAYLLCMQDRGWAAAEATPAPREPAAVLHPDGRLCGLGLCLEAPAGFMSPKPLSAALPGGRASAWLFRGPGNAWLTISFQKLEEGEFRRMPHPLSRPFRIYARNAFTAAGLPVDTLLFFGRKNGTPLAGFSAYVLVGDAGRVGVTAVEPLPSEDSPPPGLALGKSHKHALDAFSGYWRRWLSRSLSGACSLSRRPESGAPAAAANTPSPLHFSFPPFSVAKSSPK